MKDYLLKLLEEISTKKNRIKDSYNNNINAFTYGEQKKYSYYLAQEEILIKILNERFNLKKGEFLSEKRNMKFDRRTYCPAKIIEE